MKLLLMSIFLMPLFAGCKTLKKIESGSNLQSIRDGDYLVGLRDVDPQASLKLKEFSGLMLYEMVVCDYNDTFSCSPIFAPISGKPVVFMGGTELEVRERLIQENVKSPEQFIERFNNELYEDLVYVGRLEKLGDSLKRWGAMVSGAAVDIGAGVAGGCAAGTGILSILVAVTPIESKGELEAAGCMFGGFGGIFAGLGFVLFGTLDEDNMSTSKAAYQEVDERIKEHRAKEEEIVSIFEDIMRTDNLKRPEKLYKQNTATAFKYLGSFLKLDFNNKDLLVKEWLASAK